MAERFPVSQDSVGDADRRIVIGRTVASSNLPVLTEDIGCKVEFCTDNIRILALYAGGEYQHISTLGYESVDSLAIGGEGAQTHTTGGRMIGGGFGLQGALLGMATAALVNKATTKTTSTVDTTIYIKAGVTELLMHNTTVTPQVLQVRLAPTFAKIEAGQARRIAAASGQSPAPLQAPSSVADELKKLADLLNGGVISESEFAQLKARLLLSS